MFVFDDEDLRVGDLVKVNPHLSSHDYPGEFAIVIHYHRPMVNVRGSWVFYNDLRGYFSWGDHRIQKIASATTKSTQ